jgi:hypothetical protein
MELSSQAEVLHPKIIKPKIFLYILVAAAVLAAARKLAPSAARS